MAKEKSAMFQMIICSFLWSIAGIIIKLIDANPFVISGFRSLFSALTVFVFMMIAKTKFVINKKAVIMALCMSLVFLLFVSANKLTTAANAIVLQFTAPVFVLIVSSVFLKQKLKKADVIATVITLFGIALFFFDELDRGHLLGNIIAIAAGFFLGVMFVCASNIDMNEKMTGTLLAHIITASIGIPFMFFTKNTINADAMWLFVLLGVVQLGIPYILLCYASRYISPVASSLLSVIEPLLNPVWVAIFYNEIPGVMAFVGGVVIIVTITIWCVKSDTKK